MFGHSSWTLSVYVISGFAASNKTLHSNLKTSCDFWDSNEERNVDTQHFGEPISRRSQGHFWGPPAGGEINLHFNIPASTVKS